MREFSPLHLLLLARRVFRGKADWLVPAGGLEGLAEVLEVGGEAVAFEVLGSLETEGGVGQLLVLLVHCPQGCEFTLHLLLLQQPLYSRPFLGIFIQ